MDYSEADKQLPKNNYNQHISLNAHRDFLAILVHYWMEFALPSFVTKPEFVFVV